MYFMCSPHLENKKESYVSLLLKEYRTRLTSFRLDKMQEELKGKSSKFESIFNNDQAGQETHELKVYIIT